MGHTLKKMKQPASEYFARDIWISANPEERMLPLMIEFTGLDRFFIGSDIRMPKASSARLRKREEEVVHHPGDFDLEGALRQRQSVLWNLTWRISKN